MENVAFSAATKTTNNLSYQITKRNILATVTLLVSSILIIIGALHPIGQSIGTYNYILMGAGSLGLACFALQLIYHCKTKSKISNLSIHHSIIPTSAGQPSSSVATSSSNALPNPSDDNAISTSTSLSSQSSNTRTTVSSAAALDNATKDAPSTNSSVTPVSLTALLPSSSSVTASSNTLPNNPPDDNTTSTSTSLSSQSSSTTTTVSSSSTLTSALSSLTNPISEELLNQLPSSLIEALGSELTTNLDVLLKCQIDNLADFYQKITSNSRKYSVQISLRNDSLAVLEKEGFSSQVIINLFKIFNFIPEYKNSKLNPVETIVVGSSKLHIKLNPNVKTSRTIENYLNILGFYREEDSDSDEIEMVLQSTFGHTF